MSLSSSGTRAAATFRAASCASGAGAKKKAVLGRTAVVTRALAVPWESAKLVRDGGVLEWCAAVKENSVLNRG